MRLAQKTTRAPGVQGTKDSLSVAANVPAKDTAGVYGDGVHIDFQNYVFSDEQPKEKPPSPEAETVGKQIEPSDNVDEQGNYKVNKYKLNFSPDIIYGNAGYSTFYGVEGTTEMAFSDMLGNHQIYFLTNLISLALHVQLRLPTSSSPRRLPRVKRAPSRTSGPSCTRSRPPRHRRRQCTPARATSSSSTSRTAPLTPSPSSGPSPLRPRRPTPKRARSPSSRTAHPRRAPGPLGSFSPVSTRRASRSLASSRFWSSACALLPRGRSAVPGVAERGKKAVELELGSEAAKGDGSAQERASCSSRLAASTSSPPRRRRRPLRPPRPSFSRATFGAKCGWTSPRARRLS